MTMNPKARDEKKLEQMLLEGVRSGRGIRVGSQEWDDFNNRLKAEAEQRAHQHKK
jgi:hypothetical protein